jgi:hypothetical protein
MDHCRCRRRQVEGFHGGDSAAKRKLAAKGKTVGEGEMIDTGTNKLFVGRNARARRSPSAWSSRGKSPWRDRKPARRVER